MRVSNNFVGQPLFLWRIRCQNHRKALRFVPKCLQARCMRLQWWYFMGLVSSLFAYMEKKSSAGIKLRKSPTD